MHTNGPWEAREGVDNYPDWNVWNSNGWFVVACHSKANARLIAAAPELLQRLEDARNAIASLDEDALGYASGDFDIGVNPWPLKDELLYRIDEAIRKAKSHADTLKGE